MNQSRLGSLIEALFNVAIGLGISLIANALVYPQYGFRPSFGQSLGISLIYTAISIGRQYLLRRFFNSRLHAAAAGLARRVA